MTAKPAAADTREPLILPGRARRALHLLLAAAGWALFAWWWWIVLGRTGRDQMVWTAVFLAISLVVIVTVTALWVMHNVNIFRRRGPRRAVRASGPEPAHDVLGRPLRVEDDPRDVRTAPVVRIVVEGGTKRYRSGRPEPELRRRLAALADDERAAGGTA